jgi:integrase
MRSTRTWDDGCGFIRKDSKGRDVYVIRKQIDGKRYKISTRAHSAKAAFEQLRRFEADPENYRPRGVAQKAPIYFDTALANEFLTWSRDVQHNTPKWVAEQKYYLAWWADQLPGCNLRGLSLHDRILPALEKVKARAPRIAVLKRLYSWLRKLKHSVSLADDPTFQMLSVPQARPAQWKRVKTIPREHIELALEHLTGPYRDGLEILAGTGWHVSELIRFARGGEIEPLPRHARGKSEGVLVCPQTKQGSPLRVVVSARVLKAGERLLARGQLNRENFDLAVKGACRAAKIPTFTPGRLRHSIATHAINAGADMAAVASFLNHKSPRTTARYYATHATPAKIPTFT